MVRRLSFVLPVAFPVVLLFVATLFTFGTFSPPAQTVTLPIEVLGADGHTESVTVNASDAASVDRIWLAAYSVAHSQAFIDTQPNRYAEPKAEVRLNGGPWVGITNRNVTCNEPLESTWNCVQGPFHTTMFSISTGQLGTPTSGDNTLEFRFNYADTDISSGYYVLGMAFLNAGEAAPTFSSWPQSGALDQTSFAFASPQRWSAPDGYDNATAAREGEALWNQRNLLRDFPGGPQIEASCADCHAQDGEDLETFSFSNKSIIARAAFHTLSEDEGKKIAAYIRSNDASRVSWPWQPPYQPGPTIASPDPDCDGLAPDDAPQKCWTAGAGIESVLESDREMKSYLFPNGIAGAAGQEVASTQSTLNLREIPISLQYPDWNEWLPRVHPIDASAWSDNEFKSHPVWTQYANGSIESDWQNAESSGNPQQGAGLMRGWYRDFYGFRRNRIDKDGDPGDEKLGYAQWKAVKTWEIMRGREDLAPAAHADGEARSWLGADRTVFDVAPHINKNRIYGPDRSMPDNYFDTIWYDLQMVLNAGNRTGAHVIRPMDWKYHLQHARDQERHSGYAEPYRYARSYIKQNQVLDTGDLPESDGGSGLGVWHWRHTSHAWLTSFRGPTGDKSAFDQMPTADREALINTILEAYLDRILRVPTDGCSTPGGDCAWGRASNDPNDLEPADHVPDADARLGQTTFAEHFYQVLPWLEELGARNTLLDSAYTWAAIMWPRGNNESVMGSNPTWDELNPCAGGETCAPPGPSATLTAPAEGTLLQAGTAVTLSANASSPDGDVARVAFYANGTKVAEATAAPYTATWGSPVAGEYTLTANVVTSGGQTSTSAGVSVSVIDAPAGTNGVRYAYYEGDWDQLPNFSAIPSTTIDTTSNFDVSVNEREDFFAIRFVSYINVAGGDYTFHLASDDGSALFIDGAQVVDNDGLHALEERSGAATLAPGWHKVEVQYLEAKGGQELYLDWESASFAREPIPDARLFLFPGGTTHSIPLETGWNTISSYAAPSAPSLDAVFSETSALVMVKDETGASYIPDLGINEIGDWQASEGYQVYVERAQTLQVAGDVVPATEPVSLSAGWNFAPFYPQSAMDAATALASIQDVLVMVKDAEGNAYIPDLGVDEIGTLVPGEGYEVYVMESATLTYPEQTATATVTSTVRSMNR